MAALLATLGWMLAAQPYRGVRHDAVLYWGQVLIHSRVPELGRDIFFASGSQDRYSVYAPLVQWLYAMAGEHAVIVVAVLLSWALMAGALWPLLKLLDPRRHVVVWGLLAFAVLSHLYAGGRVFSYAEPFLTARTFAEPLLLWSLVALLRSRLAAAATLQGLALFIHPLMTLPIMVTAGCYLVQQDRRWLWTLAVLPLAAAAGAAGVPPWDGLFRHYDPYWWSLVSTVNAQVLLQNWTLLDWLTVSLDLAMLLAVTHFATSVPLKRLLRAVVLANAALFGAAALLADGLQLVLVTQLQLWRVQWIAHLLAMAVAPWLLMRLWMLGGFWPASACAIGLALLNMHTGGLYGAATLAMLLFTTLLAWRVRNVSSTTRWLVCGGILACIVALTLARLHELLDLQDWRHPTAGLGASTMLVLSFPTVAFSCVAALWIFVRSNRGGWVLAGLSSVALFAAALACWDQRTDLARATESPQTAPHPFTAHLPPHATVYWPGQLIPVWALLERASHYAPQQGSGMLFNRNNAMAFGERRELYRKISEDYDGCQRAAALTKDRAALAACDVPSAQRLATLCRSWAPPDAVVLPERIALPPLATWQPPARLEPQQTFALYSCKQLAALQP